VSIPLDPALELPLARALHDRAADHRTEADLLDRLRADPGARALVVLGDRVATTADGTDLALVAPAALRMPAAPDGTFPDGTFPDGTFPDGTFPDGTFPDGTFPDGTFPDGTFPDGTAPDGTAPRSEAAPLWTYLGEHAGTSYLALVLPAAPGAEPEPLTLGLPEATDWRGLRRLEDLDALEQGLVTQAVALANWHAVHRFCPRCGAATRPALAGWVRHCPVEDVELYPRTDPAVIMAVVDDADRILLGHAAHWPEGRFSTLAGFVEPGESLEQAVRREVAEEARLVVADGPGDVVYRGSQSWPFPASLMLGFRARVAGTGAAPRADEVELTDARWFTRDALLTAVEEGEVLLPGHLSIARALIEEWYGGRLPD
jgi:NAD+ diphosphatase